MQEIASFSLDTSYTLSETDLGIILFPLSPGDRIFLTGDLWSGKSTFARALLRNHFQDDTLIVRSPTYTYYQKYTHSTLEGSDIYHFDLYRIDSYEDIFLIGADDILRNPESICIIEWPEILAEKISPTKTIHISTLSENERTYTICHIPPIIHPLPPR